MNLTSPRPVVSQGLIIGLIGQIFLMGFILVSAGVQNGALTFTLFDDAMVTMTYAKTLVETGEFVWFDGAPKVQGITTLAWAFYMAGIHLLGFEGSAAALIVSITSAGLIGMISNEVRKLVLRLSHVDQKQLVANCAAISIFLLYPLVFWSLRGFEVGLLALLLVVFIKLLTDVVSGARGTPTSLLVKIFAVVALGIAVRTDFIVPALAAALPLILSRELLGKYRRTVIVLLVAIAFSISLVFAFQFAVWGDVLPNTYYLKLDNASFIDRAQRGVLSSLKLAPFLLIAFLAWALIKRSPRAPEQTYVANAVGASALAAFSYSVYVGGDVWEQFGFANRFFTIALPLIILLAALAYEGSLTLPKLRSLKLGYIWLLPSSAFLVGFGTNPVSFSLPMVLVTLTGLSVVGLVYGAVYKFQSAQSAAILILLGPAITFSSSVPLTLDILSGNVQYTSADLRMKELGEDIKSLTSQDASVAIVWAGSIAYYTERKSIDLLGKSDRVIARESTPPIPPGFWNSDFYPGHNKYNLSYSVGQLRPDVVAQTLQIPGELTLLESWGYNSYCTKSMHRIYVLDTSSRVNRDALLSCP